MSTKALKTKPLPSIPDRRYFTIGEASELCGVKPHVLRYWEQEFSMLRPAKRRGSRRYYQQKDIQLIRGIRELLYDKGFTISGARRALKKLKSNKSADEFHEDEIGSTAVKPVVENKVKETPAEATSSEAVNSEYAKLRHELEALIQELKGNPKSSEAS